MVKQLEFDISNNNREYMVESICDSTIYAKKLKVSHLSGLYYLVFWKNYSKDENT